MLGPIGNAICYGQGFTVKGLATHLIPIGLDVHFCNVGPTPINKLIAPWLVEK
jgi:hypothetical protein